MDNPTRITGTKESTIPWLDFGYTEGDAAGKMYINVPQAGQIFFQPDMAPSLLNVQKSALAQATTDAQTQRVTIQVTPTMTDAQIVAAVKAKLE